MTSPGTPISTTPILTNTECNEIVLIGLKNLIKIFNKSYNYNNNYNNN
jgi:hypothetical protein